MEKDLGEIRINLNTIVKEGITPSEYSFLYLLYNNNIQNAYTISELTKEQVYNLEERGFVKCIKPIRIQTYYDTDIVMDEPEAVLDTRGLSLFEVDNSESKFTEFWNMFPQKVPDGQGGFRVLRTIKLDTHDAQVCKKKYLKLIKGNTDLHEKILKGLKNQLYIERHRIQFINNPETWLNQKIYEKYQDDINPNISERIKRI